jgi:metal-responsive CopG/Arc/MetJ family transcriptional regulator
MTIDEAMLARIDRPAISRDPPVNRSRIIREAIAEYLMRAERRSEGAEEKEIFRKHRTKLPRQATALVKEQAKPLGETRTIRGADR